MVTTRKPQEKYGVVSATTIKGESVVNREDEKLGKIDELMIDAQTGHLAYAVLSFSGSHYAVPWSAFEFANTENILILDLDKRRSSRMRPGSTRMRPGRILRTESGVARSTSTTVLDRTGENR